MESSSISINPDEFPHKTSKDTEGKFLFIRHGQTFFNSLKPTRGDFSKYHSTEFADVRLTEEGIEQAKSLQPTLNKLKIEKVYSSPFYRALQTAFYALENHPNLSNITVIVNPLAGEGFMAISDMLLDIKKTKEDFNMETKVKFDWSLFNEYIKEKIKLNENFYYFYYTSVFPKEEKKLIYDRLCEVYKDGKYEDINLLKQELLSVVEKSRKSLDRMERMKVVLKDITKIFAEYKKFLKDTHKDTLNDKESKIITFSHCQLINSASFKITCENGEIKDLHFDWKSSIKNSEILSIYI